MFARYASSRTVSEMRIVALRPFNKIGMALMYADRFGAIAKFYDKRRATVIRYNRSL